MTLYLDLTGPLGTLAFAINGAYHGVALELPRPLDCRGRHVPLLPHLLLRNMDVAVDFAGTSGAASGPVVHPRVCFRPWQVTCNTGHEAQQLQRGTTCGRLNIEHQRAHVLYGSHHVSVRSAAQTSPAMCMDARACTGCARRAWPRGRDGPRRAATRVVLRGPHAGRPARRADVDLARRLLHVRETLCLPPT